MARRLEDGPLGGTVIRVGDDVVGVMVGGYCPQMEHGLCVGLRYVSVAQTAHQLENGQLWLPGEFAPSLLPVCRLGNLAFVGPLHRDINGIGVAVE